MMPLTRWLMYGHVPWTQLRPVAVQSLSSYASNGASAAALVTEDAEKSPAIATNSDEPSSPESSREAPPISIDESADQNVAGLFRENGTDELPIVPSSSEEENPDGETGRPGRFHRRSRGTTRPKQSELDEVNSFLASSLNVGEANPPLQSFPDMTISPERIYPATHPRKVRSRRRIWVRRPRNSRPQSEQDDYLSRPAERGRTLKEGRVYLPFPQPCGYGVERASSLCWRSSWWLSCSWAVRRVSIIHLGHVLTRMQPFEISDYAPEVRLRVN